MARRPRIGVTGPSGRFVPGRIFASLAVRSVGGRPIPLRPSDGSVPDVEGLVVTGGSDIEASLYGATAPGHAEPDPLRDEFELAALRLAEQQCLPVLGICRGSQLLNVQRGGTLFTDITDLRQHTSNRGSLLPRKKIHIEPDSRLNRYTGRRRLRVNSLHHQAVRRLGRGLSVVARDLDGIIQAIEGTDHSRFILGVQWHPEYLAMLRPHRRLFRALVQASRQPASVPGPATLPAD